MSDSDFVDDKYEESEEYEEFLFTSIKRYNTLQMFDLENTPEQLFQMSESSICVVSRRNKKENSELLELKIPEKLILPIELESRSKQNDFKIISGHYTEGLVYKAAKLSPSEIITSEYNTNALKIYNLKKDTDVKFETGNIKTPNFIVLKDLNNLIYFKNLKEPLTQIDISNNLVIKNIKHPFYECGDLNNEYKNSVKDIKCGVLDRNTIAILNSNTGNLVLHDLRTDNNFINLPKVDDNFSSELWTLSEYDFEPSNMYYFGVLSNKRSFCIYDKRNNSVQTVCRSDEVESNNLNNLKLKFSDKNDRFSISGVSAFVDIYKIDNNDFEHVFTHNGHAPGSKNKNIVTDHIWLNTGNREFVVSICDNKSLNCWNYNTS